MFLAIYLNFFFIFYFFSEIEAVEACKWLRAAGFPQYAQMYEGKCWYKNKTKQKDIQFKAYIITKASSKSIKY